MSSVHNHSIPIALVDSFFFAAKRRGVELSKVFSRVGLDYQEFQDDLKQDPLKRMELIYIDPLLRVLWDELRDEASGFTKRPVKPGTFAMMCHAIITAKTLRQALMRCGRFMNLVSDELIVSLSELEDEAYLDITFVNRMEFDQDFLITSLYIIWIRLSCWLIERPILLDRMEFSFARPIYHEEYSLMFPCRCSFSQHRNRVVFGKRYLDLSVAQDSSTLVPFLKNAPASLLKQFRSDDSVATQVKRLLLQPKEGAQQLENQGFDAIALALHITTHTLRRRLKSEGTSFQEIKDNIRRDQAIALLERDRLSVQDIALTLGFSEAAAFNRAFKKWTGVTPGAYRDRVIAS